MPPSAETTVSVVPLEDLEKLAALGPAPGTTIGDRATRIREQRLTVRRAHERLLAIKKTLTGPRSRELNVEQLRLLREHAVAVGREVTQTVDHARRRGLAEAADLAALREEILRDERAYSSSAKETRQLRRENKLAALEAMDGSQRVEAISSDPVTAEALLLADQRVRRRLAIPDEALRAVERRLLEDRDPQRAAIWASGVDHAGALDDEVAAASRTAARLVDTCTDHREIHRMERRADREAELRLKRMLAGGDDGDAAA